MADAGYGEKQYEKLKGNPFFAAGAFSRHFGDRMSGKTRREHGRDHCLNDRQHDSDHDVRK